MSARAIVRRFGAALLVVAAACTDTNLTGPSAGSGGTIVFASDRDGSSFEIWRVGGDGRGLRRLTNDADHNDLAPVLSRDGRRIAWEREITAPGQGVVAVEIWVMNADGSDAHVVVANGSENRSPSWDASDAGLVYASYVGGDFDIWRVPLDAQARPSGAAVNLTHSPYADQWPRVSPDGSRIVFQTNRDLDFEIYVMNADGSVPMNLSNSGADDRFPTWAPDGSAIVWSRYDASFDLCPCRPTAAVSTRWSALPTTSSRPPYPPTAATSPSRPTPAAPARRSTSRRWQAVLRTPSAATRPSPAPTRRRGGATDARALGLDQSVIDRG